MLPFNHGIISDHRALWIDLHIPALFKSNITDIYTCPPQMTTKNVNWTKNARKLITKHIRDTSVRSNIDNLLVNLHNASRESNIKQLEQIDSEITNAMIRGAKDYNNTHSVWWSPTLHYA